MVVRHASTSVIRRTDVFETAARLTRNPQVKAVYLGAVREGRGRIR